MVHQSLFWVIVWPIAYTVATSSSTFQFFFTPFLFLIYFVDVKLYIREKSSSFYENDNTPKEGLPMILATLWAVYRLTLFDDSYFRDDYEPSIDKDTFIDLFLYSIAGGVSSWGLGIPAYLVSFVTP